MLEIQIEEGYKMSPLGSQYQETLTEASIPDGSGGKARVVIGSQVKLIPVELQQHADENNTRSAREEFRFHVDWLGSAGPYTITSIGLWPCGRLMLYVRTPNSSGAGVYASDLMPA